MSKTCAVHANFGADEHDIGRTFDWISCVCEWQEKNTCVQTFERRPALILSLFSSVNLGVVTLAVFDWCKKNLVKSW